MAVFRRLRRALFAKITRVTLDRFVQEHASTARTLDIGAQTGPYAVCFPNRVAIDLTPRPGIHVVTDAQRLAFCDGSFEVILCTEVLEHIPDPQSAIDEMFRVLAPGGRLVLTTRFLFPIHDAPHDYFRFTKYGLRHLLRRFDALDVREETTSVGTLAVLVQRLGMQAETLGWSPARAIWLVLAQILRPWSRLISREYGDSQRLRPERGIMTSGYHVACRKPLPLAQ